MRDYLEALLEEQQEPEREAAPLPEEPAAGGTFRRDGGEAPEREADAPAVQPFEIEGERSAAPDGEISVEKRAGAAEWMPEAGLEPVAVFGAERVRSGEPVPAEPEPAQRGQGVEEPAAGAERWSGGALYADLVRREAAAAWPETAVRRAQPMPLSKPGSPAGAGTVTLAELDRAVQRDARRYDSPFPLY